MTRTTSLPPLSIRPISAFARRLGQMKTLSLDLLGAAVEAAAGPTRLTSDHTKVIESDRLSTEMLESLFANESAALHVRHFCSAEVCDKVSEFVLSRFDFTNWSEFFNATASTATYDTDMFYGVGLAQVVVLQSEELRARYFAEVLPAIRSMRAAVEKAGLGPTDKLRLELDELWPTGAQVKVHTIYRRKMLAGIGRLMRPAGMLSGLEAEGIVHVDSGHLLSRRRGLFSANVYITMPKQGGELAIWNLNPSLLEYLRNTSYFQRFGDVFIVDRARAAQEEIRAKLPAPLVIKPGPGDLVLFNSGRPHTVRGFDDPCRLTFQSFIDYAEGKPLAIAG